jgi:hypothetical protein
MGHCMCSMCLFLQNQDFEQHTEALIATLYGSSAFATDTLADVSAKLGKAGQHLEDVDARLKDLQDQGEAISTGVNASLGGLEELQTAASGLEADLGTALKTQVRILGIRARARAHGCVCVYVCVCKREREREREREIDPSLLGSVQFFSHLLSLPPSLLPTPMPLHLKLRMSQMCLPPPTMSQMCLPPPTIPTTHKAYHCKHGTDTIT